MKTLAVTACLACIVLALLVADFPAAEAASGVDCSQVVLSLADCLAFVSEGSTLEKPVASCCSGLKTVLKASPDCLNSGQFGVKLNISKALSLPVVCNLNAPHTNCGLAPAPKAASPVAPAPHGAPPAHAPKSASAPEPAAAPGSPAAPAPKEASAPSPSSGYEDVPAPAPEKSGSTAISTSISLVIVALGLFVASF
uniref:Bifunctional inhibitor/plant lipid transfer protein/seed storage helical domain-containing protein n=1 Tax=Kalanchoe fedtschenkoi TaxID=63787 RepID=A0A7N0T190_KALFE